MVSPTECWTRSISVSPSDAAESSSSDISAILETIVPSEVLFEREGGCWDAPPRRCAGAGIAPVSLPPWRLAGNPPAVYRPLPPTGRSKRAPERDLLVDGEETNAEIVVYRNGTS